MISLLIGFFAPRLGEKYAKIAAYAVIVVLAVGLFFGAKKLYDLSVVRNHDAKIEASQAKADRAADQKAAVQKENDLNRQQYEQDQLTQAMDHAPHDPKINDAAERRIAFHKCLSLQQRARANGLQPPACV